MPSRDPKRCGNDEDFVPATQYPKITKDTVIPELPNDRTPPDFEPLFIENGFNHGSPNLPPDFDDTGCFEIFKLFFTDELMDLIVYHTNTHANMLYPKDTPKGNPRRWKPTSRQEIYAYFGVLIYMGIHKEPAIEDYWRTTNTYGPIHPVSKFMSKSRFEAIDRYFYCTKTSQYMTNPFERIWEVSEYLRKRCRRFYNAGIHFSIDESIKRFTGHASEIVNIPSKPTPEGFKMWILANEGYVLDWLFHAKGSNRGPYMLDTYWVKEEGFTPTEAVVLDLLLRKKEGEPPYLPNNHIVWVDNLFSSVKLFERLRQEGIGAGGTVRTVRTKRERYLDKKAAKRQSGAVESTQDLSQDLSQNSTQDLTQEQAKDQDSPKELLSSKTKEQFSQKLMNIKLYHTDKLKWGELYWDISKNKTVLQAAWKDAQVVLFASTVVKPESYVDRMRKRPAKTATNAACTRAVFGNLAIKLLSIPDFIDLYNHYMNGVDRFDQTTSYYSTQRAKRKTWKPLWFFLLDLVLSNSYRLSAYFHRPQRNRAGHKKFLETLVEALFNASGKPARSHPSREAMSGVHIQKGVHGSDPSKINTKLRTCLACAAAGRKRGQRRVVLGDLDGNQQRRACTPQTLYGCELCNIPFCKSDICWNEHLKQVELANSM